MGLRHGASRRHGHPANPSLRRRAHGEKGSGGDRRGGIESRPLYQPDHGRRYPQPRAPGEIEGARSGSRPDLVPGRGPRERRAHRRLPQRDPEETRRGPLGNRDGAPADHQCADPSPEHPQCRPLYRSVPEARRPAARNRSRTILRLGLSQPRRADPDLRADRSVGRVRGGRARTAQRHPHHRHGGARLLRQAPEALHGRLGQRLHEHHPVRQGAALPCRGVDPEPHLRQCAGPALARHLVERGGLQRLPRHGMDEGALPLLRLPRG